MSEPCNKDDKINRLEQDVVGINERLNRHSEKIDKISDNNLVLETIMKRLEEDSKEQKQTNAEMQKTMVSIQGAMTEITFNVRELNTKLVETNDRVDGINDKFSNDSEKNKIDIRDIIKSKIIPILTGGGCIYGLAEFIKGLIK